MFSAVPPATLQVHSVDIASVLGLLSDIVVSLVVEYHVIVPQFIDRYHVLSRVILESTSDERLGEEES